MFISALFIIAKSWKEPRCPSTEEWIQKIWYIYTMEYYSANKSNDLLSAWPVQPIITNTKVNITNEAIVIPETGRLDVPIVPVKRPATITNNNDNINETIADTIAIKILCEIKNPYNRDKDLIEYYPNIYASTLLLFRGNLAVFEANDVHAGGIFIGQSELVQKIVVKIPQKLIKLNF